MDVVQAIQDNLDGAIQATTAKTWRKVNDAYFVSSPKCVQASTLFKNVLALTRSPQVKEFPFITTIVRPCCGLA
jgi:hypothetical protein